MFVLKKTITPFILPPGIFILAIVLTSFGMIYRRRWKLGAVNMATGLALWALSVAPVSNLLMQGLESDFSIPENPSADVIIMLGGGVIHNVPDFSGPSAPSSSTMGRIVTTARLYQRLQLPVIVTGGRSSDGAEEAVATIAKRFLVDLGVPEDRIIVEDRARDTAQNARLTAAICRQHGYTQPILITAAYHLKRARMAFDVADLPVTPFPAYFLGSRDTPFAWRRLLPRSGALHTSATALHEYVGIWYYRLVET